MINLSLGLVISKQVESGIIKQAKKWTLPGCGPLGLNLASVLFILCINLFKEHRNELLSQVEIQIDCIDAEQLPGGIEVMWLSGEIQESRTSIAPWLKITD